MNGTYDLWLVTLSMTVAVMASYVALDLASRVTASAGRAALYWLLAGSVSMGMGIWSMHFIAMLAFRLPIPMSYSMSITALSLLIAMVVSGFALHTVSRQTLGRRRLLGGGVLMGIGIAAMHYTGMAAMEMTPPIRYDPMLFALSIVVAIVVALVALWIAFRLRDATIPSAFWRKAGSAVLMGAAICGMHYTGMAAAIYAPHSMPMGDASSLDSVWMAAAIGTFTVMLLATTLLVSISDARRRFELEAHQRGTNILQQSHDELELRVRERTGELARINTALEAEIVERQRSEQALRASEDEAREIVNTAYDAYIAIDAHSRILEWNQRTEQTFGWMRAEAMGRKLADLIIPAQHREAHARGVARFLATGEGPVLNKRIEISALHRDGHEFPVELTIWPVKVGDSYKFNAFLHDITERRQAIRRLAAQTAAAAALVEADGVAEAAPRVLEAVASALEWSVGALWTLDDTANDLRCIEFWRREGVLVPEFEQFTRSMRFAPEMGLPGRVWSSGKPLWIADVARDSDFPRAESALEDELHAAFAFPIISGTQVLGVAAFFSSAMERADPELLRMMDTLGSLLGQFIERKRAEALLRQSEERFATAFSISPDGITISRLSDGRVLEVNRSWCELSGWSREENIGSLIQELGVWVDYADRERYAERLRKDRRVRNLEIPMRRKTGELRDVSLSSELMEVEGQTLTLSFTQDITERKRAQAALEDSRRALMEKEHRLAEAQSIAHVGSWEWDVVHDQLSWSDELYRIYGLTPSQFEPTYEGFVGYVHPDDRQRVRDAIATAFEQKRPFRFEHRIVRPDGSVRVQQSQGRVIVDAEGRTIAMFGTGQDITESKDAEEQLRQLAHFDPLTGLPNRREFYEALRKAMSVAEENDCLIPVLFLDLDRFKNINDTLGHVMGDELLRQVSARVLGCLRIRDTVGRLGGDEFGLVLMTPPDPQIAARVASKVLAALREPFLLEGREVAVTASIGITVYPTDTDDIDTLIKFADTAMYEAKESGRDTYHFYTAEMNARALYRMEMETALRRALERGEFLLHYQPKICLGSGRWTGTEALLRWQRPEHGLVMPGEFIPTLEDTGLIVPVGHWAINTAAAQIAAWRLQGIAPAGVAVNVSGKQVLRGTIESHEVPQPLIAQSARSQSQTLELAVAKATREHGIDPDLLELELTESTLMVHGAKTVGLLQRLKALGIRISIDDFGTGYSSLAYLKRFPIDTVKIDRGFVQDVTSNADDAAIVTAIISMAHSLKLRVVAEGVETIEQLEFLGDLGCDEAQGFLIARPMTAEALASLFSTSPGPSHLYDMRGRRRKAAGGTA